MPFDYAQLFDAIQNSVYKNTAWKYRVEHTGSLILATIGRENETHFLNPRAAQVFLAINGKRSLGEIVCSFHEQSSTISFDDAVKDVVSTVRYLEAKNAITTVHAAQ